MSHLESLIKSEFEREANQQQCFLFFVILSSFVIQILNPSKNCLSICWMIAIKR